MTKYARRLQKVGSSILISLPSDWVRSNNLRKGSIVSIEVNRDQSLSMFPSEGTEGEVKEVIIPYPPASMNALVNQIYGAYLLGYDVIRIKGKSSFNFDDAERIKLAMRKLVGLEVVDEDSSNISLQFLLDTNTLEAEKILRRMNSIVAGMYRDTIKSIKSKEKGILKAMTSRDDEVDRQYFLLVRLIRSAMVDQRLATKLNLSNIDILDYRIAANHLESAGDYIVDLATTIHDISAVKSTDLVIEAANLIEKMQEKAVMGFTTRNRSESTAIVQIYDKFTDIINSIKEMSAKESRDPESTIAVLNSTYSMDKIARCWVDVADLVKPVYLTASMKNA